VTKQHFVELNDDKKGHSMQLLLLLLGIVAGVLSGMFGIGGGIVIVPVLVAFFGFEFKQAVATSLTALLMPVGIFAVIAYYRAGKLRIAIAAPIAVGLIVGGLGGAELAQSLPVNTLQRLYAIFLFYVSWRFIEPRKWLGEYRSGVAATTLAEAETTTTWYVLLIVGLGAGVLSGMFGIGGGLIIVPILVALLHFDQKLAVGTSLGALLLPVGAGAVYSYYQAGMLDIPAAAFVALGLVGGAFIGAKIALGLPEKTIKRLYGIFLFIVALRFLFQA
jgi:uncharacterized membrane protein YfcA